MFRDRNPEFSLDIEILSSTGVTNNRLSFLVNNFFKTGSSDLDIAFIDVIDSGDVAHHLFDYYKSSAITQDLLQQFDQEMLQNNIRDGRLVALPLFTDMGLLYYRYGLEFIS